MSKRIAVEVLRKSLVLAIGIFILGAAGFVSAEPAPQQSTPRSAGDLVSVRLSSDTPRIGPGETFHLIVEFAIKPDWHIYWKNPGETGAPTLVGVTGPNYDVGEPVFARPERIDAPDGITFGYEKRAVIAIPVTAPQALGDGHARFEININYLVCKSVCLMGRPTLQFEIATSSAPTGHDTSLEALGEKLEVSFPQPFDELEGARVNFDGKALTIIAPAPDDEQTMFFPMEMPGVTYGEPRIVNRDSLVHMIVPVEVKPANALGEPMRIAGLVAFGEELTKPCYEFELPVDVSDASQADSIGN